jgi:hypothetical protein
METCDLIEKLDDVGRKSTVDGIDDQYLVQKPSFGIPGKSYYRGEVRCNPEDSLCDSLATFKHGNRFLCDLHAVITPLIDRPVLTSMSSSSSAIVTTKSNIKKCKLNRISRCVNLCLDDSDYCDKHQIKIKTCKTPRCINPCPDDSDYCDKHPINAKSPIKQELLVPPIGPIEPTGGFLFIRSNVVSSVKRPTICSRPVAITSTEPKQIKMKSCCDFPVKGGSTCQKPFTKGFDHCPIHFTDEEKRKATERKKQVRDEFIRIEYDPVKTYYKGTYRCQTTLHDGTQCKSFIVSEFDNKLLCTLHANSQEKKYTQKPGQEKPKIIPLPDNLNPFTEIPGCCITIHDGYIRCSCPIIDDSELCKNHIKGIKGLDVVTIRTPEMIPILDINNVYRGELRCQHVVCRGGQCKDLATSRCGNRVVCGTHALNLETVDLPDNPIHGVKWMPIKNHRGYYASETGLIRSPYGILKGSRNGDGYRCIGIQGKQYLAHRLVAMAFIENPEEKPCVDHINRLRDDNHYLNLRWVTPAENSANQGEHTMRGKKVVQFDLDGVEIKTWDSASSVDEYFEKLGIGRDGKKVIGPSKHAEDSGNSITRTAASHSHNHRAYDFLWRWYDDVHFDTSEIWLPIIIFEDGRERISDKFVSERGNVRTPRHGISKGTLLGAGYRTISVFGKTYPVHRLVAATFKPDGAKAGLVVDHIDRNRENNHMDNLRWVTSAENAQLSFTEAGGNDSAKPVRQIDYKGDMLREFISISDASRVLRICQPYISDSAHSKEPLMKGGFYFEFITSDGSELAKRIKSQRKETD